MFTGEPSGLFAPIYVCLEHGEIWQTDEIEDIDIDNDDVNVRRICPKCHRDVMPLLHDGRPVMHPLTGEEAYWETSSPFDEEEEEDFDPDFLYWEDDYQ